MNELAKIDSFRSELAIAETIEEIKLIGDAAKAYQYILKRQGANKSKVDEIGDFSIEVDSREAEWLNEFYGQGETTKGNQYTGKIPKRNLTKMPVPPKESARVRKIKEYKETKPEDWNFDAEDKNFDDLVFGWRRFTVDIVSDLWIFYNKLKNPGSRTDLVKEFTRLPTWDEWLNEFYPSNVRSDRRNSTVTKTETVEMPVPPKDQFESLKEYEFIPDEL